MLQSMGSQRVGYYCTELNMKLNMEPAILNILEQMTASKINPSHHHYELKLSSKIDYNWGHEAVSYLAPVS